MWSILRWLRALLNNLLKAFGVGGSNALPPPESSQDTNMLSIFVRTNIGEKVHVQLIPDWTVAQIKAQLVPQLKTSSANIKLIFAGKELPDSLQLSQCDLGQNSVLHAVRVVTAPTAAEEGSTDLPAKSSTSSSDGPVDSITTNLTTCELSEDDYLPRATTLPGDTARGSDGCVSNSKEEESVQETTCEKMTPANDLNMQAALPDSAEEEATVVQSPDPDVESFAVVETEDRVGGACNEDTPDLEGPEQGACQRLLCDASTVITIQLTPHEQEQLKQLKEVSGGGGERPHFYVYCVTPCGGVRPGKLRVRCEECHQGAITLMADPQCWADVLTPRRMLCSCATPECSAKSSENYAEFYFKCGSHVTTGEDDISVPLYMIRANLPGVVCLSCGDVTTPVIVFQCEASHVMCLDCFITYCLSNLSERQFTHDAVLGYTLPCPVKCPDSLISEVHHFRLMGDEQYTRYQHWATEEAVLAAGGVLCPRPGCGHGLLPDPECVRIRCVGGCGFVFCRNCLQEYHTGDCWQTGGGEESSLSSLPASATFSMNAARAGGGSVARWDVASAAAIQSLTKPCPKCKTPTERSGGCMHMVCTRASCRFNWCWVCHTEWTRDCMASHWFG